ncbi:hypothetical protein GCM10010492_74820 [Saccharothrix mutabilis subsp. mutabilis]|uniref:Rrf2 family transcriptional regulator n=2 Tax=Saccharothrix mutabilis TaxID=33921 RepID=A0ABN0UVL0_9PSEU
MGEGVEWAVHCCLSLAWVGERAIPATRLAAYYDLPAAYLNKQLQALARAGVLTSTPGPRGGFRLARAPERITLMDVVSAVEGPEQAFRCTEIRHRGPAAGPDPATPASPTTPAGPADPPDPPDPDPGPADPAGDPGTTPADDGRCAIDLAMSAAELAWRRELAARTVADLMATVERTNPDVPERVRRHFTT